MRFASSKPPRDQPDHDRKIESELDRNAITPYSRSLGPSHQVLAAAGHNTSIYTKLVKRLAESQGYRATIEKEILGGVGKIDIALEQDEEKIACEISVTSSGRHELGNVQKCLAAGYRPTMYCPPTRRL